MSNEAPMDVGLQPLDALMNKLEISNHDLVAAVQPGYLTHKQVQKGRKGRRLTPKIQDKILHALNVFIDGEDYTIEDLFNYRGKH